MFTVEWVKMGTPKDNYLSTHIYRNIQGTHIYCRNGYPSVKMSTPMLVLWVTIFLSLSLSLSLYIYMGIYPGTHIYINIMVT